MLYLNLFKDLVDLYDHQLEHCDERIFLASHAHFVHEGFEVWDGKEVKQQ